MNIRKKNWSEKDNIYLEENYQTQNNTALGKHLRRTPEAVRKQLNKLKLKRRKKSYFKQYDRKIPKDHTIFQNLRSGRKKREKTESEVKKIESKIKIIADNNKKKKPIYHTNDLEDELVVKKYTSVYVDSRTTLTGVEVGKEKEALEAYKKMLSKGLKSKKR